MDQAIKMANEFLSKGDLIVYSEGRAYPRYEARANGSGRFQRDTQGMGFFKHNSH